MTLNEGAGAEIHGWGKPFVNTSDPQVNGWINENEPIVDDVTLLGLVQSTAFLLAVKCNTQRAIREFNEARLPPPFEYGYNNLLDWDPDQYCKAMQDNKSSNCFMPAYE